MDDINKIINSHYLLLIILGIYSVVSFLTFVIYAMDKSAARKKTWRIPEKTLHIFSLICGWPGALTAQKIFRHKTQKQPFRFIFWLTIFTNLVLLFGVLFLKYK